MTINLKSAGSVVTNCGCALALITLMTTPQHLLGQTAFTYQGRLADNSIPANGNYDLQFALFDAATNGVQISDVISSNSFGISNGLFSVTLDFGPGDEDYKRYFANSFIDVGSGIIESSALSTSINRFLDSAQALRRITRKIPGARKAFSLLREGHRVFTRSRN